jgi:hypothetical protein
MTRATGNRIWKAMATMWKAMRSSVMDAAYEAGNP